MGIREEQERIAQERQGGQVEWVPAGQGWGTRAGVVAPTGIPSGKAVSNDLTGSNGSGAKKVSRTVMTGPLDASVAFNCRDYIS